MTTVLDITADTRRLRGRGALSNASSRYDRETRVLVDDGWQNEEEELPPLKTEVMKDSSRTIITRNNSPDISFSQSINPYKGCEHGCIYCFARPTHAYRALATLAPVAAEGLAKVAVSVTTLDRKLAGTMEPRASTPPKRLETIRALT